MEAAAARLAQFLARSDQVRKCLEVRRENDAKRLQIAIAAAKAPNKLSSFSREPSRKDPVEADYWEDFVFECERQLRSPIEQRGFEYLGFVAMGRWAHCDWAKALSHEERLELRVWVEQDGSIFMSATLSWQRRGQRVPWLSRASMNVNTFVRKRLGGQSLETYVHVGGMLAENFAPAVAELGGQLEQAFSHFESMMEALLLNDPELRIR
jgi:hypothetical protein